MHKFQPNVRSLSREGKQVVESRLDQKTLVYTPNSRTNANMTLASFDSTFTALKEMVAALQSA